MRSGSNSHLLGPSVDQRYQAIKLDYAPPYLPPDDLILLGHFAWSDFPMHTKTYRCPGSDADPPP